MFVQKLMADYVGSITIVSLNAMAPCSAQPSPGFWMKFMRIFLRFHVAAASLCFLFLLVCAFQNTVDKHLRQFFLCLLVTRKSCKSIIVRDFLHRRKFKEKILEITFLLHHWDEIVQRKTGQHLIVCVMKRRKSFSLQLLSISKKFPNNSVLDSKLEMAKEANSIHRILLERNFFSKAVPAQKDDKVIFNFISFGAERKTLSKRKSHPCSLQARSRRCLIEKTKTHFKVGWEEERSFFVERSIRLRALTNAHMHSEATCRKPFSHHNLH